MSARNVFGWLLIASVLFAIFFGYATSVGLGRAAVTFGASLLVAALLIAGIILATD